jgi:hypothetical protein
VALAVVIVTSALIPARAVAGASLIVIVTGYDTTPDWLVEAVGEIAVTVPVRSVPIAVTVTLAAWPVWMAGRSLSTTSVVTVRIGEAIVIAAPAGASKPAVMLTALTTPSIGARSVAVLISRWIEPRSWDAFEC